MNESRHLGDAICGVSGRVILNADEPAHFINPLPPCIQYSRRSNRLAGHESRRNQSDVLRNGGRARMYALPEPIE